MELSTLSVTKTLTSPPDYWLGATRLVVVVAKTKFANVLVAYGVDPDSNSQVFEKVIFADQLGTFFKYLIDGYAVVHNPFTNAVNNPDTSVGYTATQLQVPPPYLDIPAQQPPPPGPKAQVVLTYATAVSKDEYLAELGESAAA